MFSYKNELVLNNKFNKSTNIIHDAEECKNYIITQSTKDTLKTFFKKDYHNSIALIGPFGSGKSSLLLYINTLLSNNKNSENCSTLLRDIDKNLFSQYKEFIENKKFIKIKIVGEHTSFKSQFKNTLCENKFLKRTKKYLEENEAFQVSKALELLDKDLLNSAYTDILFSIDEFGKFIEYSFEGTNQNDIFDLQTIAEYINKKNNYKLIISLHKAFSEYSSNLNITYSDWDKIQGRFESIVFKDDYYEMLNVFKETISLNTTKPIKDSQKIIHKICNNKNILKLDINLFEKIAPIHPFSAIVISEIFTRYFQNQRSIFSFLFSNEPHAFQEFIDQEEEKAILYSLHNLYDYTSYLLKVYSIILPDKEMWYIAEHRLKDLRASGSLKQNIIKTIALVHTFKLSKTIRTDSEYMVLSLLDKYSKKEIIDSIDELIANNILVFQEQTQSYSLIEDSNININKELNYRLSKQKNINFEIKFNQLFFNKFIVAKKYFIEYGSQKSFEKVFVLNDKKVFQNNYKIFFSDMKKEELLKQSKKCKKSLFIPVGDINSLKLLIEKIDALKDINEEFNTITSSDTKEIINNMIDDYRVALDKLFIDSYSNSTILQDGMEYRYSSKQLQNLLSTIAEDGYKSAPKINNYTFNHTVANKGTSTIAIKKLFEAMLNNNQMENLGIEKFPAEKALYLSVVKPAGIHNCINGKWQLTKPDSLNFEHVWKYLEKELVKKLFLDELIDILANEPFGLNRTTALFMISLFILVNKEKMHIIRDHTYTYVLTIDLLINMWKASNKYQLQTILLSDNEASLFKAYVQITTDLTEYSYSKDKVVSIIKTLYSKFSILPEYAKTTKNISKEAKSLRSALISMKDPVEAFFKMFPNALGYDNLENISNGDFIKKFKNAFNEIALSYKKEIVSLEKFFADTFHFSNRSFPFGNKLLPLSEKLSKIETLDTKTNAIIRNFTYSNSFIEFIDNISVILIGIKIEKCDDNDIVKLKDKLEVSINKILSKLELLDISTDTRDVRKLSLASLDLSLDRVISVNKNKIDTINKKVLDIQNIIPHEYTKDEKLFLISQLLNEELKDD